MTTVFRHWTWAAPFLAWMLIAASLATPILTLLFVAALIGTVLAAVHHAELIADRVGEPFGTFILALAVTVIDWVV